MEESKLRNPAAEKRDTEESRAEMLVLVVVVARPPETSTTVEVLSDTPRSHSALSSAPSQCLQSVPQRHIPPTCPTLSVDTLSARAVLLSYQHTDLAIWERGARGVQQPASPKNLLGDFRLV